MADADPRALALAGVVQAAALVHRTANGQAVPAAEQQALLVSVPTHRAASYADVFPDPGAFAMGAGIAHRGAVRPLAHPGGAALRPAAHRARPPARRGSPRSSRSSAACSTAWTRPSRTPGSSAASTSRPSPPWANAFRSPATLRCSGRTRVADRIRALLLAGVRLAWLWQQLGGRRWHLILRRKPLLVGLRALAESAKGDADTRHNEEP